MKGPTIALDSYLVLENVLNVVEGVHRAFGWPAEWGKDRQLGSQYLLGSEPTNPVTQWSGLSC